MVKLNSNAGRHDLDLTGNGAWYVRVSDTAQDITSQRSALDRFLDFYGATVASHLRFEDEGWRRHQADIRPDFQRMLKMADAGIIQWIIVDEQSRLSSGDNLEFLSYMYRLRKAGCRVYAILENQWLTDDSVLSIMQTTMSQEKSKTEGATKAHRILRAQNDNVLKGEWQGGVVPYGINLVAINKAGKEAFRVEWAGRQMRYKIMPGGERIEYEGKNNMPPKDNDQVWVPRPSLDNRQLEIVNLIFERFASTADSFSGVARWLTDMGVKDHHGKDFDFNRVRTTLQQSLYIGRYSWNKTKQATYYEISGGQRTKIGRNKKVRGYMKDKSDWITVDGLFDPIVPFTLWEKVQGKLNRNPERKRAPRSQMLWLAGLVYCKGCGEPMRGVANQSPSQKRGAYAKCNYGPEYFCRTYANRKKGEVCPCKRNAVKHNVLEKVLADWMAENKLQLEAFSEAQSTGRLEVLAPYRQKHRDAFKMAVAAIGGMVERVKAVRGKDAVRATGIYGDKLDNKGQRFAGGDELTAVYRQIFSDEKGRTDARLAEVDAEHTSVTNQLLNLPQSSRRAVAKAQARLAELEGELDELEAKGKDLGADFEYAQRELGAIQAAYQTAYDALTGSDQTERQKAEQVRAVVGRIVCDFSGPSLAVEIMPLEIQPGNMTRQANIAGTHLGRDAQFCPADIVRCRGTS